MLKVGIIGASGYAGAELVRILSGHPEVKVAFLTSRQYAGRFFSEIYPAMQGFVNQKCVSYTQELCDQVDFIFTALPHKISMQIIPPIIAKGKKVIDLSADFRFKDPRIYEKFYQTHTAQDLLMQSVYGLSEVYAQAIAKASLVGNPGCYPTTVLLPLVPLLKKKMIKTNIIADSKSGVSGAGRSLSLSTHFCQINEALKAYKIGEHRHAPEMNAILTQEAQQKIRLTFVPHLIPVTRGMLTTIYAETSQKLSWQDVYACLHDYYQDCSFIRICQEESLPDILNVRTTNFCDLGFKLTHNGERLIMVAVIDNLVKGAAGQAVQNMNIMAGLNETLGFDNVPAGL